MSLYQTLKKRFINYQDLFNPGYGKKPFEREYFVWSYLVE